MGGRQDKDTRQEPDKGRGDQERLRRPGQDPVHPDPGQPSPERGREEGTRRREEDLLRDEHLSDDEF
ncbi:hypothetical protein ACFVX6_16075 [Streptomyces sp. NPDC058289]|uniref:hypothetical protein n=1 Tax=Streptomyces sp. NPDC058289 TaxID=3346425 RepID=UPI0036EBD01B